MKAMSVESKAEQIERVRQMATDADAETWDLSANDRDALVQLLADRDVLLAALKGVLGCMAVVTTYQLERWSLAQVAITKAEGK